MLQIYPCDVWLVLWYRVTNLHTFFLRWSSQQNTRSRGRDRIKIQLLPPYIHLNLPVYTPWSLNPPISTPKPTNLRPLDVDPTPPPGSLFCSEELLLILVDLLLTTLNKNVFIQSFKFILKCIKYIYIFFFRVIVYSIVYNLKYNTIFWKKSVSYLLNHLIKLAHFQCGLRLQHSNFSHLLLKCNCYFI